MENHYKTSAGRARASGAARIYASTRPRAPVAVELHHQRPLPLQSFGGCYPLQPEAFARSLHGGSGAARLVSFKAKLERGAAVTVVVVGGSVAAGFAAGGPSSSEAFVETAEQKSKIATIESAA